MNLAGEPLPSRLVEALYARGHVEKVYNLYGPSEDTTYSTWALVPRADGRSPAIGRPVAGSSAYVLDERLELVPTGSVGQLHLGGSGLARGYLGRPEQTAERFAQTEVGIIRHENIRGEREHRAAESRRMKWEKRLATNTDKA